MPAAGGLVQEAEEGLRGGARARAKEQAAGRGEAGARGRAASLRAAGLRGLQDAQRHSVQGVQGVPRVRRESAHLCAHRCRQNQHCPVGDDARDRQARRSKHR